MITNNSMGMETDNLEKIKDVNVTTSIASTTARNIYPCFLSQIAFAMGF